MHAHAFFLPCTEKAHHTRWFQCIKTQRLCASRLIILITLPSSDAHIPHPTNKHHGQINRQTSLKQHLPLTTSAHQLKGSHRRSIEIDSLHGWRVSKYAAFSFTTDGTDTNKMEKVQRRWAASVSTKLFWLLIRNFGTDYCESASSNAETINRRSCNYLSSWMECMLHHQSGLTSEWTKRQRDWLTINLTLEKPTLLSLKTLYHDCVCPVEITLHILYYIAIFQ